MKIGIPRESRPDERLVAASPATVAQLLKLGYDVVVETGAGAEASFPDAAYVEAGASVADAKEVWASDIVTAVNTPTAGQMKALRKDAVLVAMLGPAANPEVAKTLAGDGVTAPVSYTHLTLPTISSV